MQRTESLQIDSPAMRSAGRDALSLALMDARNRGLRWAAAFEGTPLAAQALWELGHAAWFQEHWIARNVQRQRGERCDPTAPKLASILPEADDAFARREGRSVIDAADAPAPVPDAQTLRHYLVDSLETTLELLGGAGDDDDALYFYRLALLREDALVERYAELAQNAGIDTGLIAPLPARPAQVELLFPATRWTLGQTPGGLVFDEEKWAHDIVLPEFEIDAQAVSWAQYAEFVADGGYDDKRLWSDPGWDWVQRTGRRTPRHVDQMRGGVLQMRIGKPMRVPLALPAVHVSWHEANAWCRWAGRRLPGEAEWEAAAVLGATRGFRWGEVREWTAGTLRRYPGAPAQASPGQERETPQDPAARVLRGASFATRARLRSVKGRCGAAVDADEGFMGFRSCAI